MADHFPVTLFQTKSGGAANGKIHRLAFQVQIAFFQVDHNCQILASENTDIAALTLSTQLPASLKFPAFFDFFPAVQYLAGWPHVGDIVSV